LNKKYAGNIIELQSVSRKAGILIGVNRTA